MKNRKSAITIIAILSAMHFMTDFICAFAVYSRIKEGRLVDVVLYNFCAFVLQMPLGLLADVLKMKREEDSSLLMITAGAVLTATGLLQAPVWVFGLGNALFHVGGGMITMHKDQDNRFKGRGLGSFVAPGALGLFTGNLVAGNKLIRILAGAVMAVLWVILILKIKEYNPLGKEKQPELDDAAIITILVTVLVVVIRSYIGLSVSFGWKGSLLLATLNVICVARGKTLGGFAGRKFGYRSTVIVSLVIAAATYVFGYVPASGLAAVLLFNMTMPVTLYLLAEKMRYLEGFAFGILTFALFVGYYLKVSLGAAPFPPGLTGALGSLVSLALLYPLVRGRKAG